LAYVCIERANWQLAMYAVHLATGNTIHCRSIKAGTMEECLRAVAKFCARSNPRDPRKAEQTGRSLAPQIQAIINEVKRWEDMPNRREPFTIEMLNWLVELRDSNLQLYHPDSLLTAMIDWFTCGLFDGFRLSEWAQPNGHSALENPHLNKRDDPCAFCIDDFRFLTDGKVHIPTEEILELDPTSTVVGRDFVKYRTQKNGKNGEERQHTRNPNPSSPCHVKSSMRIVQRFVRLVGKKSHVPLCVYRHNNGETRYIQAADVEKFMRLAASKVYKLDPVRNEKYLKRWSSHSIRVGACVILHGMGFTDTQIQFLLRWTSNAFYVYLRNIAGLAAKQNRAIHDLSTMPNFI
jgi:hypothetical protein